MPRPIRGGWIWDEERVRTLADLLRKRLSSAKIAAAFNERYGSELTKGNIESALRNTSVPLMLRAYCVDADELLASHRDRTGKMGRPKKDGPPLAKKRSPKKEPQGAMQAAPPVRKVLTMEAVKKRLLATRRT